MSFGIWNWSPEASSRAPGGYNYSVGTTKWHNPPIFPIKSNFTKAFANHISDALYSIPDDDRNTNKLNLVSELFLNEVSPYNYEVLQYLLQTWKSMMQQDINTVKKEYDEEDDVEEIQIITSSE